MTVSSRLGGYWRLVSRSPLAHGIGFVACGRLAVRVAGLITLVLLARMLSAHGVGSFQLVMSALGLAAISQLGGIDNHLMQSAARGQSDHVRYGVFLCFAGTSIGGLCLALSGLLFASELAISASAFVVAGVLFPLSGGLGQWKAVMLGEQRYRRVTIEETCVGVSSHVCLWVLLYGMNSPPLAMMVAAYLGPPAVWNVVRTVILLRNACDDSADRRAFRRYGVGTSLISVASTVAEQSERVLLPLLWSPALLGVYVVADRLGEYLRSLAQDAAAVLAPRFARERLYVPGVQRIVLLASGVLGCLNIGVAFLVAPWLVPLLFGEAFQEAVPIAQGLLLAGALGNVGQFQMRFIRSHLDLESFRVITLAASFVRILTAIVAIPALGLWGAVASVAAYRVLVSAVSWACIRRRYTLHDCSEPQGGNA